MLTFIFSCLCVHTQFVTSCNSAGDSSAAAAARRRRCLKTKSWLTSRPTPAQACAAPRGPLLPSHGTYYSLRYEKRASERASGRGSVCVGRVGHRAACGHGRGAGAAQDRVIVEFLSRSLRQFRLPRCERGRKGRDEGRGRGIARVTTE